MNPQTEAIPSLNEVISLSFLKRWWPMILCGAVGAALLTAGYLSVTPQTFEAEIRIVIQKVGLGLDGMDRSKEYDNEFLATQAEVIQSPAILERSLASLPILAPEETFSDLTEKVDYLKEGLSVTPLAKTDIMKITYQHENAEHAAERLRSIVSSYREHLRSNEQSTATRTVELLTQQESTLTAKLNTLQQQLIDVRKQTLETSGQSDGDKNTVLEELTNRWVTIKAELVAAQANVNSFHNRPGTALPLQSTEYSTIKDLERDLAEAQSTARELEQIYGSSHPELIAVRQRVLTMKLEMDSRVDQVGQDLEANQARLSDQEQTLANLIQIESERAKIAKTQSLTEQKLQQEIERLSDLHASTLTTLESVKLADRTLAEGRASVLIEILGNFAVPEDPVWPKPIPLLAISFLLGGGMSLAIAVLMQTLVLSQPQEFKNHRALSEATEGQVLTQVNDIQRDVSQIKSTELSPVSGVPAT